MTAEESDRVCEQTQLLTRLRKRFKVMTNAQLLAKVEALADQREGHTG